MKNSREEVTTEDLAEATMDPDGSTERKYLRETLLDQLKILFQSLQTTILTATHLMKQIDTLTPRKRSYSTWESNMVVM